MFPDDWVNYSAWDYAVHSVVSWLVIPIVLCIIILAAMLVLLWMFRDRREALSLRSFFKTFYWKG